MSLSNGSYYHCTVNSTGLFNSRDNSKTIFEIETQESEKPDSKYFTELRLPVCLNIFYVFMYVLE